MDFIFDLETTGLPVRTGFKYAPYTKLENYNSSRILSISWIVSQNHKVVQQAYYIITPDGFAISPESTAIHGITMEQAVAEGVGIHTMFEILTEALESCQNIVSHNIDFDINILKSELHRYGRTALLSHVEQMNAICTMKKGKELMNIKKFPKLSELYRHLYQEDIENAHNAQYDTYYCYKCFTKIFPIDRSVFFFGNRAVKLTQAQQDIVYEDIDKNILVVAIAGAGKTTSVICRIKHLIDSGVDESSIILTTFTRDAANDMKNKLFDIMGYRCRITVGTIDSISKMYSERYMKETKNELKDVSEYGHLFSKVIQQNPSVIKKYKYMFVDEIQDINDLQFGIIQEFYKQGCKIFGVGDDAQNIYSFRGSKVEYMLNFEKHFENTSHKFLIENFRSTRQIIALANSSIEKNENAIPKTMIAGLNKDGNKPIVQYFNSNGHQNMTVFAKIKDLIKNGVPEHEIAVLCPINQPLFQIEEILTKNGIKNVYLDGKCDVKTSKKPWHVCLCTIHKAKGLEWDHVFTVNMSDDILPKTKTPMLINESRRLFYVAITRARDELYIYYAASNRYVTRFVSELDRCLIQPVKMDTRNFEGTSDLDVVSLELSVTKLIENLDGGDYIKMKEMGIIPDIQQRKDITRTKIYESFEYIKAVENDDLYSDFGIFIEKLIKRDVGVRLGREDMCIDKHAASCLANLKLDSHSYSIYTQYKSNFKMNMKKLQHLMTSDTAIIINKDTVKAVLEENCKFINPMHMDTIVKILVKIRKQSDQYKLPPHKVPVFTESFLPEGFETYIDTCFKKYGDIMSPYDEEMIKDVWQIAKCKKIVSEGRRRLLYKNIDWKEFMTCENLYININTKLMDFLTSRIVDRNNVTSEEELEIKEGVYGELDLRIGDLIIDYKTSIKDEINLQWLLQLLCYKTLFDLSVRVPTINKIGILNPLRGWYDEIDVSTWNKHHELIKYLLDKRSEKLSMIV
jgi:DNA polymerase III epsilon subunit-like protein